MKVNQLVVFAILMENNGGILDKSPCYIMEKAEFCMNDPDPTGLLDRGNYAKYLDWVRRWRVVENETVGG